MKTQNKQLTHVVKPRTIKVKCNTPNDAGNRYESITIQNDTITIKETGDSIIEEVGGPIDVNWDKAWFANLDSALEPIYNKKTKVASYIKNRRNKHSNMLLKTQQQISDDLNISVKTVSRTMQSLIQHNFIKRRPGYLMISPDCVWQGGGNRRMEALRIYNEDFCDISLP